MAAPQSGQKRLKSDVVNTGVSDSTVTNPSVTPECGRATDFVPAVIDISANRAMNTSNMAIIREPVSAKPVT